MFDTAQFVQSEYQIAGQFHCLIELGFRNGDSAARFRHIQNLNNDVRGLVPVIASEVCITPGPSRLAVTELEMAFEFKTVTFQQLSSLSLNRLPAYARQKFGKLAALEGLQILGKGFLRSVVGPFDTTFEIQQHHTGGCFGKCGGELLDTDTAGAGSSEIKEWYQRCSDRRCNVPGDIGEKSHQRDSAEQSDQRAYNDQNMIEPVAQHLPQRSCLLLALGVARYASHNHRVLHP